jgi:hypothetical protein
MVEREGKRRETEEPETETETDTEEGGEDRPDEGAGMLGELAVDVLEDVIAWLPDGEHAFTRAASWFMRNMVDWSRTRRKKTEHAMKTWAAAALSKERMQEALATWPAMKMWTSCIPCDATARVGNVELLMWMRERGCQWHSWTFEQAASRGHLETLKWLRAEWCPWDAWTCYAAASNGHLEPLKWLRANGCPWDEYTCIVAVGETLIWAHSGARETWPCAGEPCAYAREHRADAL